MTAIHFQTTLYSVNDWTILRLPKEASSKLSSRGQTMVQGTLNGTPFETPLEPDGDFSHWFSPDRELLAAAQARVGDTVDVTIEPIKTWPEPEVPIDWQTALKAHPKAHELWQKITPMARWEWIRWARGTTSAETHQKRILVGCSKLESGERRPCCWNRNLCSEPSVSKSGLLLEPART